MVTNGMVHIDGFMPVKQPVIIFGVCHSGHVNIGGHILFRWTMVQWTICESPSWPIGAWHSYGQNPNHIKTGHRVIQEASELFGGIGLHWTVSGSTPGLGYVCLGAFGSYVVYEAKPTDSISGSNLYTETSYVLQSP